MSTLTLVLWLQNGTKYADVAVPDRGGVPWDYRLVVIDDPTHSRCWEVLDGPAEPVPVRTRDLVFALTEHRATITNDGWQTRIGCVDFQYQLGRRRWHYLCTTDWTGPRTMEQVLAESMPPHVRERRARIERANESYRKHLKLLAAGAFPGDPSPIIGVPPLADVIDVISYFKP